MPTPPLAAPPRFAALRIPAYRRYFTFSLMSMMADNIEHVISYWVMFQAFHSAALGGFAVISHWVPFLLLSLYTGALADRHDCRRLIQISQALFMLASISWGLLFLAGRLQMWHAVVLLVIHGLAGVVGAPASQLIIHDMVPPEDLPSAIRLNASSRYLSILLGPAVGGGLMLLLGPAWGLLTNVLIYLPFTILLTRFPYTGHAARGAGRTPRARSSGCSSSKAPTSRSRACMQRSSRRVSGACRWASFRSRTTTGSRSSCSYSQASSTSRFSRCRRRSCSCSRPRPSAAAWSGSSRWRCWGCARAAA